VIPYGMQVPVAVRLVATYLPSCLIYWSHTACLLSSENGMYKIMLVNKDYLTDCIKIRLSSVDLFTHRHHWKFNKVCL